MKAADIRNLDDSALASWIAATRFALFEATFKHADGKLVNHALLGQLRKMIARGVTEASKREAAGGLPKGSLSNRPAKRGDAVVADSSGFLSEVAESFGE